MGSVRRSGNLGGVPERTLHFGPVSVTTTNASIGRGSTAHHDLDDPSVSRMHAEFTQANGAWNIRDLSSTHGTFVNGVRVDEDETVALYDGDHLRLGSVAFDVQIDGEVQAIVEPKAKPSVDREEFLTRGSLLVRLGDDDSIVREVSWNAFRAQYAPIIRGFARNAGCPEALRDDVVQDVMSAFFKAAERFEYDPSRGRFRGYLKTATVNTLTRLRHKRRGEVGWNHEQWMDEAAEVDRHWADEWLNHLLTRAVANAKATSNVAQSSWDAFELYGRRGVPAEAAAEQLGMSMEAVQKAKSRVAALVRAEIEELRAEE